MPISRSFYRSCVAGVPGCRSRSRAAMGADMVRELSVPGRRKSIGDLGRLFGGTFYECEARFLVENEWAMDAEDILERRTKHGLHLTDEQRADFAAWFEMATPQAVR